MTNERGRATSGPNPLCQWVGAPEDHVDVVMVLGVKEFPRSRRRTLRAAPMIARRSSIVRFLSYLT